MRWDWNWVNLPNSPIGTRAGTLILRTDGLPKWGRSVNGIGYQDYPNLPLYRHIDNTEIQWTQDLDPGLYVVSVEAQTTNDVRWATTYVPREQRLIRIDTPPEMYFKRDEISWKYDGEGISFELWLSDMSVPEAMFYEKDIIGNSYTLEEPLRPGKYRAWIRIKYDDGTFSPWTSNQDFTLYHDPVIVTGGLESSFDEVPEVSWSGESGADSYELFVGLPGQTEAVYRHAGITTLSHEIGDPLNRGVYDVWVRGHFNNGSMTRWGKAYTMTVGSVPVLTQRSNVVTWDFASDATHFEIWMNRYDDDGNLIENQAVHSRSVRTRSYAIPIQPDSGTYSVWVRALRLDGGNVIYSGWSSRLDLI